MLDAAPGARAAAELDLRDVRKSFGKTEVLHGITLRVEPGEMMVLVGASGCGKSTLLRIAAGLESPTSGRVVLGGRDVTGVEPHDRDVAMVFQNYALYPHMTVRQNMAYGLRIRGTPRAEAERRVAEAAAALGLDGLLDRRPRQLSGGQRQRVAMGRAIVREPRLFLFDEPLSNLDARLRVQTRAEIRRLQRRLGVTSVFVTHDQVEAMTLGDRLAVMVGGRAAQVATPMEVWSRPADTTVATFIGSPAMNLVPATLAEDGAAARVTSSGALVRFADGPRPGPDGAAITLGLRPEHVEPGAGDAAAGADVLPLAVDLVEPLGSESVVHGRLPDGTALTARLAGVFSGATLPVRLASPLLHVFDAEGRRLEPSRRTAAVVAPATTPAGTVATERVVPAA